MNSNKEIEEIIRKDHYKIALQDLIVKEHDRLEKLEKDTGFDQLKKYYLKKQVFCFRLLEFVQGINDN